MPSIFHDQVLDCAVRVHEASNAVREHQSGTIVHEALFALSHDAICVHRAIGRLVDSGWASPASILLRTSLDFVVSALAITQSSLPELAAFRFLYFGSRSVGRDERFRETVRRDARRQAKDRVVSLPEAIRPQAYDFLKGKKCAYWFNPEFRNPSDVLAKHAPPPIRDLYGTLSGAAHGSFMGMRIFRENPDAHNVNPELPPGRKAMSLDLHSSRILLEVFAIRAGAEGLSDIDELRAIAARIAQAVVTLPPHGQEG